MEHITFLENRLFPILLAIIGLFFLLPASAFGQSKIENSFWRGDHPSNDNAKFYIHLIDSSGEFSAKGYWTENKHYNATFEVNNVTVDSGRVTFSIPGWGCIYSGVLDENKIIGGFNCEGESFDSLTIFREDAIRNVLTDVKPGCTRSGFQYTYEKPHQKDDLITEGSFNDKKDSLFFITLIQEIIKGQYGRINSILFSKDNKLIGEEYFYNYTANTQHQIESSTKSVTSLLIGIAIDKGFISDVNQTLCEIFPEYKHLNKGDYRKITIKHVLTMTPGFENKDNQYADQQDRLGFALNRKMVNIPGEVFSYDGGNTEILGAILYRKTGIVPDEFARKELFEPLGIQNYTWVRMEDNFPLMSGSLKLTPRDFMKIGLLVLNKGRFNAKRIVSEKWIEESTSPIVETKIGDDLYAYQWWNLTFETEKNAYNVIWANGWGSQFIYIIPELNMVITTTGYNYEFDSWSITKGIEKNLSIFD